jgi:hypothetical protein
MKIHLYALCYNEEQMAPFFLQHYLPWVDRFFVYDDGSKDGSEAVLRACDKVAFYSAREFRKDGEAVVDFGRFYNNAWKKSRGVADWIVTCNMDEHFYHRDNIRDYLARCKEEGITIVPARGYDMVGASAPAPGLPLTQQVRRGIRRFDFDKLCAFNPQAIEETCFSGGRHQVLPQGKIVYPRKIEVKLLHYKYVGLWSYLRQQFGKRRRLRHIYRESPVGDVLVFLRKLAFAKPVIE